MFVYLASVQHIDTGHERIIAESCKIVIYLILSKTALFIMRARTDYKRVIVSQYFTSIVVFIFALPISSLLFGGYSSDTGFALSIVIALTAAMFTYIFWPKSKNNSTLGKESPDSSQG